MFPRPDRPWRRIAPRRGAIAYAPPADPLSDQASSDIIGIAPISPAVVSPAIAPPPDGAAVALLPGVRTPARRMKFAVVNGCTVASLLLGLVAAFAGINHDFRLAAVVLLACVVLDGFDGGLARKLGVASPFGAQMDSMADLSSFGVATGIVIHQWLIAQGVHPVAAAPACALIAVCAAVRLARFNVSPKNGRFFSGVPTTMAAAVLALNILIGPELPPTALVVAVSVYAVAMVTSFPYAKLVSVLRLPLWLAVVPAICAMISVQGTFALIVGAYLVSGPLLWVFLRGRPAVAT